MLRGSSGRYVPMFGETEFRVERAYASAPLEEQLEALGKAVEAGKVRQVGLSNETPWGLMECCRLGGHTVQHTRFTHMRWLLHKQYMCPGIAKQHSPWSLLWCMLAGSIVACLSVSCLQQRCRSLYQRWPPSRTPTGMAQGRVFGLLDPLHWGVVAFQRPAALAHDAALV